MAKEPREMIWTVAVETTSREDAVAIRDILTELGFNPTLNYRSVGVDDRTPVRDTRLGKIILGAMELNKTYELIHLAMVCEENDYEARSAAPILTFLNREGDVKRVGRGLYQKVDRSKAE